MKKYTFIFCIRIIAIEISEILNTNFKYKNNITLNALVIQTYNEIILFHFNIIYSV